MYKVSGFRTNFRGSDIRGAVVGSASVPTVFWRAWWTESGGHGDPPYFRTLVYNCWHL